MQLWTMPPPRYQQQHHYFLYNTFLSSMSYLSRNNSPESASHYDPEKHNYNYRLKCNVSNLTTLASLTHFPFWNNKYIRNIFSAITQPPNASCMKFKGPPSHLTHLGPCTGSVGPPLGVPVKPWSPANPSIKTPPTWSHPVQPQPQDVPAALVPPPIVVQPPPTATSSPTTTTGCTRCASTTTTTTNCGTTATNSNIKSNHKHKMYPLCQHHHHQLWYNRHQQQHPVQPQPQNVPAVPAPPPPIVVQPPPTATSSPTTTTKCTCCASSTTTTGYCTTKTSIRSYWSSKTSK